MNTTDAPTFSAFHAVIKFEKLVEQTVEMVNSGSTAL